MEINPHDKKLKEQDDGVIKLCLCLTKEDALVKIRKLQSLNPEIGRIDRFNNKITLKSNEIIYMKPYPIPVKLLDKIKEEVNRLIRLGIL